MSENSNPNNSNQQINQSNNQLLNQNSQNNAQEDSIDTSVNYSEDLLTQTRIIDHAWTLDPYSRHLYLARFAHYSGINNLICPICLEGRVNYKPRNCLHWTHRQCLASWQRSGPGITNKTCPVCRSKIRRVNPQPKW